MSSNFISPDSLAAKAFLITFVGAVLYFATVFVFVLNGDLSEPVDTSDRVGDIHD